MTKYGWLILTIVSGLFLASHGAYLYEARRFNSLSASLPRTVAINGYRIDLLPFAKPIRTDRMSPGPRVLLVMSDTCPRCAQEMSEWRALIAGLPSGAPMQLGLVTLSGNKFADELADQAATVGIPFAVWEVSPTALAAFTSATGIRSVPTTAILDADSRLRFKASPLTSDGPQSFQTTIRAVFNVS